MTLYEEVIQKLNEDSGVTVIPFKTTALNINELSDQRSEFTIYDDAFIGWTLSHWAKKAINNSSLRISFLKEGKKLIIYKNFDL